MEGIYLYGIIPGNKEGDWSIPGLNGSSRLFSISHQGLSCAVSDYCGAEFGSLPRQQLAQHLLKHQMAIEHLMKEYPVLPVKFGTVLAEPEEVRCLLSQGRSQFGEALAWFQDKVEVEVAATWDAKKVFQEISHEPEIVRAKENMSREPGKPNVEQLVSVGLMVKASLDQRRDSYRQRMISFLQSASCEVQPNALISDEMVMNVAFLVARASQDEFDSRVRQLNDFFNDEINFRIIGPLPPYSFATVEVAKPHREKIEAAKQFLGLGEACSEPEVRQAYRRLAAKAHLDHKPMDDWAKAHLTKLRQASDLLIAYCRGQAGAEGSFLINIIRHKDDDQMPHFAPNSLAMGSRR